MPGRLQFLGSFWNNPATSDGLARLFLCREVQENGRPSHDVAEFIDWDWYDLDWVKARVLDGTIRDRVVLCGLAFLWLRGLV